MIDARAEAIAEVERELAELDAAAAAVEADLEQRRRRRSGKVTASFSIRLDTGELAALERRAAAVGLPPSALARNLIRMGLSGVADAEQGRAAVEAIDRLENAVAELRSLVA